MALKDFTYLDFERIRSYLAQMDGKLSEDFSETSQHATGTKVTGGTGALTKLIASVEAEGNYLYTKSHSETSSLHHAIFDTFEAKLRDKELVGDLAGDKPFAEIICRLKVVDYELLSRQFLATAEVMPLITSIAARSANANQTTKQARADEKAQVKLIKDIANAIGMLFEGVKLLQLVSGDGKIIAQASLDEDLLPQKSLFFANNNEVLPQEWTVFCLKQAQVDPVMVIDDTGNDFSKSINGAVVSLRALRQILLPPIETPNVTPIAIYKRIS